jgi:hypothetical protein
MIDLLLIYPSLPDETTWLQNLSEDILAPFAVAAISYFLISKVDEYRIRRNYSQLGAAILHTLIEEVEIGRTIIKNTLDPNDNSHPAPLPRKSWNGINTVPDDVLLRILELGKCAPAVGFPTNEIRTHTKNYFDHMVLNWDQVIEIVKQKQNFKGFAKLNFPEYEEAATNVLNMLVHIRGLLLKNSKRVFPK